MEKIRLPFMMLAFINLLVGMLAGLMRMGWDFPVTSIAIHHGAIMVGGFLGTLILLEKVIPLKKRFLLVLPLINSFSLLMVVPGFYSVGQFFLLAGSLSLLIVYTSYFRKQPRDLSIVLMMIGACFQIGGHIMLISKQFYPLAFPWWMGFILFTIVGERLELSKFLPVTMQNKYIFLGFLLLFMVGVCLPFHDIGKYFSGVALILIASWLMKHDVISIAIKKEGLTRFSACALLIGCIALLFTGIFLLSLPDLAFTYDAIVHTFFLGFAISMIFAHGPIILPGVLSINAKPYHPLLYLPLVTHLLSLILRVSADVEFLPNSFRLLSGWLTAGSIILYFILLLTFTVRSTNHATVF